MGASSELLPLTHASSFRLRGTSRIPETDKNIRGGGQDGGVPDGALASQVIADGIFNVGRNFYLPFSKAGLVFFKGFHVSNR
jgi:hypothetical protein